MATESEIATAAAKHVRDQALRANAICAVLTRTDRILTGHKNLTVVTKNLGYGGAPSYTDGREIVISSQHIPLSFDAHQLVGVLGLNYHELAHVFYSPIARNHPIHDQIRILRENSGKSGVIYWDTHSALNILEDQRIERLMIAQWPSTQPYFVHTVATHILNNSETIKTQFPLVSSRYYLGQDIINSVYAEAKVKTSTEALDAIQAVSDEYLNIAFPQDSQRAAELVVEFAKLLYTAQQSSSYQHGDTQSNTPPPSPAQQTKAQAEAQEDAADTEDLNPQSGEDQEGDDTDSQDGAGKGDTAGDKADDQSDTDQAGSGEGEDGDPADSNDDSGDAEGNNSGSDSDKSDGQAGGSGYTLGEGSEGSLDAREVLKAALQDVFEDEEVATQVEEVQDRLRAVKEFDPRRAGIKATRFTAVAPSADSVNVSRRIGTELERLVAQADPGWDRGHADGRINVQRAMHANDFESVFDRWDEGHTDVSDIECVIAVDTSGSMYFSIQEVAQAAWAIKRALDAMGAKTTIFTFGNETRLLYGAGDQASATEVRNLRADGGTNPSDAIEYGHRILATSQRAHKLFFIMTDGNFGASSDQTIQQMNKAGVTTTMIYFSRYGKDESQETLTTVLKNVEGHKCSHKFLAFDAATFTKGVKTMVTAQIQKALTNN